MSRSGKNYVAWLRTHGGKDFNTGLTSFWKLDEASGATRNDSVGTNHLADNATVTQVAGKVGNCASFASASSQSLTIASNSSLQVNQTSMTLSFWAQLASVGANRAFIGKYTGAGNFEYIAQYTSFNTRIGFAFNGGTVYSDLLGAPSLDTWYHIVCGYNHAAQQLFVYVNNNAGNTSVHTDGTLASTGVLALGKAGNTSTSFHNGLLDAAGFWNGYAFTPTDVAFMYNGGNGRELPA
jgi:hypothetical protein